MLGPTPWVRLATLYTCLFTCELFVFIQHVQKCIIAACPPFVVLLILVLCNKILQWPAGSGSDGKAGAPMLDRH